MEQKEIIEGNKLIAEFMELSEKETICLKCELKYEGGCAYGGCGSGGFEDRLIIPEYHSDWNLLMPVYIKIRDYLGEQQRPSINHVNKGDALEVDIHCAVTTIDILKAHKAIVEFINWHNSNTNHG